MTLTTSLIGMGEAGGYRMLGVEAPAPDGYIGFARDHAETVLLVMCQLGRPAGRAKPAPRFILPADLESIAIESCYPRATIDRSGERLSSPAGFDDFPVLIALARNGG